MAEETGPVELYRFRVRTADGREMTSGVLRVLLPLPLSGAQWPAAELQPGKVKLKVRAPGRKQVEFTVERQAGEEWEPIAGAAAAVTGAVAEAEVELPGLPGGKRPVRFLARADDGAEVRSGEAALLGVEPPAPVLSTPEWSAGELLHGGAAGLTVHAPEELEGRNVRFVIEQSGDAGWSELQTVFAEIKSGTAAAQVRLEHPIAASGKASIADLLAARPVTVRFRAELA
ncbi:MAG TPA: hypothetical protein VH083_17745 [Myxococcales bacterium]|jgi:hypothetical protein|nr:hypothetical protein [Myxococcales bacterium]